MRIKQTDAEIGEDSYGVYYPSDGRLFTGYEEFAAQEMARTSVFAEAFAVHVRIERV